MKQICSSSSTGSRGLSGTLVPVDVSVTASLVDHTKLSTVTGVVPEPELTVTAPEAVFHVVDAAFAGRHFNTAVTVEPPRGGAAALRRTVSFVVDVSVGALIPAVP